MNYKDYPENQITEGSPPLRIDMHDLDVDLAERIRLCLIKPWCRIQPHKVAGVKKAIEELGYSKDMGIAMQKDGKQAVLFSNLTCDMSAFWKIAESSDPVGSSS